MKKYLKILLVFLVLMIIMVVLIVISNSKNNNVVEEQINNLSASKEVSNVIFTNINYRIENDVTVVSFKIFNNNDKDIKINEYVVNVYDKEGHLLGTMKPFVLSSIKKRDSIRIKFSVEEKYDNAYSLEFELPNLEFIT